ncbi:hypothetical protein HWV62_27123 [Athelia sp. TMB]|nr:hypothetical protein HWV62_27123 [Athelia sp. TMB]
MVEDLCPSASGPFDFGDRCIRETWAYLFPTGIVFLLCLFSLPFSLPPRIRRALGLDALQPFLTLDEAEAHSSDVRALDREAEAAIASKPSLWRRIVLTSISVLESAAWLGLGVYYRVTGDPIDASSALPPLLGLSWIYAVFRSGLRPSVTVPYDLLILFVVHVVMGLWIIGALVYADYVLGEPLPSIGWMVGVVACMAGVVVQLVVVINMPMAVPDSRIKKDVGTSLSLEDYCTIWQWATFNWMHPLIRILCIQGRRETIRESAVWRLSPTMRSKALFTKFRTLPQVTLLRRLWAANSFDLCVDFALTLVSVLLSFSGPYFLQLIIDNIDKAHPSKASRSRAYVYAFFAFICALLKAQMDLQHLYFGRRASTRIRSELMAAVYDKALKQKDYSGTVHQLKPGFKPAEDPSITSPHPADSGKIVNLMSVDASRVADAVAELHKLVAAPLEILLASVFLYTLLGWAAFSGYALLLLALPTTSRITKLAIRNRKRLSTARDKRMGVMNELLANIKFIKFFAWEEHWIRRTLDAREAEISSMIRARRNVIKVQFIWVAAPILVSVAAFATYVLQGHRLTVSTGFTSKVALDRIALFLDEEEVATAYTTAKPDAEYDSDTGLGIEGGSFSWNGDAGDHQGSSSSSTANGEAVDDRHFRLRDITVKIPEGELTCVTGPTASGKTALVMALLGEMENLSGGKVHTPKIPSRVDKNGFSHSIAYAGQSPWLYYQSIKENILFGSPLDAGRYRAVLDCCALLEDLAVLPDGDDTMVGARIALARAIYARTKYVILDEPLGAVDTHTCRCVFERLIRGNLLANRTVVLITHHVQLVLPVCFYLVCMSHGRIEIQGEITALRARGVLDNVIGTSDIGEVESDADADVDHDPTLETASQATQLGDSDKDLCKSPRSVGRMEGAVKWSTFKTYLRATSYYTWVVIILGICLTQMLVVLNRLWMRRWGEAYASRALASDLAPFLASSHHQIPLTEGSLTTSLPVAENNPMFYVIVYAVIGAATSIVFLVSTIVQFDGALRASRDLFRKIRFWDAQSRDAGCDPSRLVSAERSSKTTDLYNVGWILNRFGKDIMTVDWSVSASLQEVNASLATFTVSIFTVAYFFPLFLVPAALIGLVYYHLAVGYLRTARSLRRMESDTRSPIFTGFGDMLEGIVSVRAFCAERRLMDETHLKIDVTTKMWYNFWTSNRWLLLNFDALGASVVFIATIFSISSLVSAGTAALCMTSIMNFTQNVYKTCGVSAALNFSNWRPTKPSTAAWTTLELDLFSVERLMEYFDLPQEPLPFIKSQRPPAYWPSASGGNPLISVENLVVKYSPELPPVLRGVSFELKAGQRVGIVGRTGSGTMKENLDPLGEFEDGDCLDALYRVGMLSRSKIVSDESIDASSSKEILGDRRQICLDTQVRPGGSNFSHGQRQLIALARALLRRNLIIILDEPTSSIDFETDSKVQAIIRAEFRDSLLLTGKSALNTTISAILKFFPVAHRLQTIIDYDRVMVLDKGQIVESDSPRHLLSKEGGIFKNMCIQSGRLPELEDALTGPNNQ